MSPAIEFVVFIGFLGWLGLALLSVAVSAAARRILEARAAATQRKRTSIEAFRHWHRYEPPADRPGGTGHEEQGFVIEHGPHTASLRPFLAWLAIAFLAGAAVMFLAERVALGAELAPAWRSVTPPAFASSALEVTYAAHPRLKALAGQRTGPSGIDRAGRVSERDDRRGPGGERG